MTRRWWPYLADTLVLVLLAVALIAAGVTIHGWTGP